jgi:hypothetical protein
VAPAHAILPPKFGSLSNTERDRLSHLLAAHFPAAWNARAAAKASRVPTVVIGDRFGNGAPRGLFGPGGDLDVTRIGGNLDKGDPPADHGYHVSGIVLANFANDGSRPGMVTGALTRRAKLFTIDRFNDDAPLYTPAMLASTLASIQGRIVFNTSSGGKALGGGDLDSGATAWINAVRSAGLEDRLFHATSAGNDGNAAQAAANSYWSDAALNPSLQRLTNTLVVENLTESAGASELGCLDASSDSGGSTAAPGEDVWSLTHTGGAKNSSGTSFSTPVVSGLAAYLWAIVPTLTPHELISAMTQNPQAVRNGCTPGPAPPIDAYRATLSLDRAAAPSKTGYPVRMAVLDVAGGKAFNDADLKELAPKVDEGKHADTRTWSRYDLNGDGFAGDRHREAFDLDRSDAIDTFDSQYDDSAERADGVEVDEEGVTDQDVLCYYAFSPLYTGNAGPRNPACVEVKISPRDITLAPRGKQRFTATVTGSSKKGVIWSASCGQIAKDGRYIAPKSEGRCRVTATSKVNSDRKARATVRVQKSSGLLITLDAAPGPVCAFNKTVSGITPPNNPDDYFIKLGDRVTWENDTGHVVNFLDFSDSLNPQNDVRFTFTDIPAGDRVSHRFDGRLLFPNSYRMICQVGPSAGWASEFARIIVRR